MDVKSLLKSSILRGGFCKAEQLINQLSMDDLYNCLMLIAADNSNILSYTFITFLIATKKATNEEKAEFHSLASDILGLPLSHITGAYQASLFHTRKALELNPKNVENKEAILFFYEIPDQLVSRDEAVSLAKEILEEKPSSFAAKRVLDRATGNR